MEITQTPYIVSLAGNPMRYTVGSGQANPGKKALTTFTFSSTDTIEDHAVTLSMLGGEKTLTLKNDPSERDQLPTAGPFQSAFEWAESVYERMLLNIDLMDNYKITIDQGVITLEALQEGELYTITEVENTITGITIETVTEGSSSSGTVEGVLMQVRDQYNNLLGEDFKPYETLGIYFGTAHFDVSEYLYAYLLDFTPPHFYLSIPGSIHHNYSDYVLKYKVGFAEKKSGIIQPFLYDSYRYAMGGGFSREKLVYNNKNSVNWFNVSANQQKFLSWAPLEKLSHTQAKESLFFLFQAPAYTQFKVKLEVWDEGSGNETIDVTSLITLTPWSVYEFTVGYQELSCGSRLEKPAIKWRVWLVNESGTQISEKRTFYLDPKYQEIVRDFRFRNSMGAYDSSICMGKSQSQLEYDREQANYLAPFETETAYNPLSVATKVKENISRKAVTGWVKLDYLNFLREFMRSLEVYEIIGGVVYPVIIKTKKTPFIKDQDNNYALEFEYESASENEFYSTL
ncbi:hypothetical protein D4S03_05840 [bacterium]|nr:MAG: hypothetical protein D4S03_05840 [bacterium]